MGYGFTMKSTKSSNNSIARLKRRTRGLSFYVAMVADHPRKKKESIVPGSFQVQTCVFHSTKRNNHGNNQKNNTDIVVLVLVLPPELTGVQTVRVRLLLGRAPISRRSIEQFEFEFGLVVGVSNSSSSSSGGMLVLGVSNSSSSSSSTS